MSPQHPAGKHDYRIFVGAFPNGELAEEIESVRMQYDPVTARITPPHVTLAGTYWRSGPATVENEAEAIRRLEILTGILPPFELRLGGVRTFPGERPVVYLDVQVTKELIEARNLLLSVLGMDKHREFHPHLTMAMRLPWDKAWGMVSQLQGSAWNTGQRIAKLHQLQLMQRGPLDSTWRCIYQIRLET